MGQRCFTKHPLSSRAYHNHLLDTLMILGMLMLPFARRRGWIGWACVVAAPVLILLIVLLIVVGMYERVRTTAVSRLSKICQLKP